MLVFVVWWCAFLYTSISLVFELLGQRREWKEDIEDIEDYEQRLRSYPLMDDYDD